MGLKNIEKAQVLRLGDEVEYQQGQIVSKTLAQNCALSMTLFAFEQDEGEFRACVAELQSQLRVLSEMQEISIRNIL